MKSFFGYRESSLLIPLRGRGQRTFPVSYRHFFLTFTDAVRSLFAASPLPPQATIMLPGFYCPDTISFFERYGTIVFYRINDDLSVDRASYRAQCATHRPAVIVQYAYFGFPDDLAKEPLATPPLHIIHDGAHRLTPLVHLPFPQSVFINSIRKRTTFLGSHVIGATAPLSASPINEYAVRCALLHARYAFLGFLSMLIPSMKIYEHAGIAFEALDAALGTNNRATRGDPVSYWLWNHLDFEKLISHATMLWEAYCEELAQLSRTALSSPNRDPEQEIPAYFPLLIADGIREPLIAFLEKRSVFLYPLWECPDRHDPELNINLYRSLCVLPLTMATTCDDIRFFGRACQEFFKSV